MSGVGETKVMILMAYNGAEFAGWQIQPDRRTVQGEMRTMLTRLLGRDCCPEGAGRTDAGVHARGQVCHFTVEGVAEAERIERALPSMAPPDILVREVRPVSRDFSARFSATGRRYTYHLSFGKAIFDAHVVHTVLRELDHEAMDRACGGLVGRHDFTSFCKRRSLKEDDNTCVVDLCRFHWQAGSAIFEVRADRFLHHMVRNLVGTLLEIGRGQRPPDSMPSILSAMERASAGRTAPACGLFLEEVYYPPELLIPASRRTVVSDDSPDKE